MVWFGYRVLPAVIYNNAAPPVVQQLKPDGPGQPWFGLVIGCHQLLLMQRVTSSPASKVQLQ